MPPMQGTSSPAVLNKELRETVPFFNAVRLNADEQVSISPEKTEMPKVKASHLKLLPAKMMRIKPKNALNKLR